MKAGTMYMCINLGKILRSMAHSLQHRDMEVVEWAREGIAPTRRTTK